MNKLFGKSYKDYGFTDLDAFEYFKSVVKELNNIKNINYGGCGISAYIMASILIQNNIPFNIVIEDWNFDDGNDFIEHLDIEFDVKVPNHILISINDDLTFDCNGINLIPFYKKILPFFSKKRVYLNSLDGMNYLKRLIEDYGFFWNDTFNRHDIVDFLKSLKIDLDMFKTWR